MKTELAHIPDFNDKAAYIVSVQAAHVAGADIESKPHYSAAWVKCSLPFWNWSNCDYRIAQPPKFRDMTPDEVPLGAEVRCMGGVNDTRVLLAAYSSQYGECVMPGMNEEHTQFGTVGFNLAAMRELFEYRLNRNVAWQRFEVAI